jgi:hypothetical protein
MLYNENEKPNEREAKNTKENMIIDLKCGVHVCKHP